VYDATETPRAGRGDLPYLRCRDALAYGRAVLERALDGLGRVDAAADGDRALALVERSLDRLGVCNRLNLLLVAEPRWDELLPALLEEGADVAPDGSLT
jgi:glutamate-5-semialdehyde dehydrogenase